MPKQAGVQTNIKTGVTGFAGACTPTPATPPSPPTNPSAIVSGAGTAAANGTYTYTTLFNGRPQYNLAGTDPDVSAIRWNGSDTWQIQGGDEQLYSASEDVAFPWLAVAWDVQDAGTAPAPTVTHS